MEAYERVLTDAMAGDATIFARQDYVEEAWRIVDQCAEGADAGLQLRAPHVGTSRGGCIYPAGWLGGADGGDEWSGEVSRETKGLRSFQEFHDG